MATRISHVPQAAGGPLTLNESTPSMDLGARIETSDGRAFRYAKAGAVALVPGHLLQAPAEITNHQSCAVASAAVGATKITVTLGATAVTANQYAGGWLVENNAAGGHAYLIKSHPAADLSTACVFTLEDPIIAAMTNATTTVDLVLSPYAGVLDNPASASSAPVGVAVTPITATYYGWIQVAGPAAILSDGGSTVGTNVSASNGTAGAVEAAVTAQAAIGQAMTGITTAEFGMFNIKIS